MKFASFSHALTRLVILALVVTGAASLASAQALNSGAQGIAINATLNESLTLSLSANAVNFNLTAGSAANARSTNLTATSHWGLPPCRTPLSGDAHFCSGDPA